MTRASLTVLYHSPCMDGFGAACEVKRNLNTANWDNVYYLPTSYSWLNDLAENNDISRIPHLTTTLLLVDICPNEDVVDFLIAQGFYLVILDHHNGVREILSKSKYHVGDDSLKYVLANRYSGASLVKAIGESINTILDNSIHLTDTYFEIYNEHGPIQSNFNVSGLIDRSRVEGSYLYRLLETRDIWIKDDPTFKQRADILASYCRDNKVAEGVVLPNLEEVFNDERLDAILKEGQILFDQQWVAAVKAVEDSYRATTQLSSGQEVTYVIGVCPDDLGSIYGEVVNTTIEGNTIAVAVKSNDKETSVSLRSIGDVPCVLVAKQLNGGGHDHASGVGFPKHYTMDDVIYRIEKALSQVVIEVE